MDHRGVAGNVTEFDGDLGLVIGAGGGSPTSLRRRARPRWAAGQLLRDRRQPLSAQGLRARKLVLQKPGVDKIAVMMSIVSNTRVDIVARGVVKACLELGYDPAEKIAIFRIPAPGRTRASRSSSATGVEYCDRSVSMHEAARRAVEKIQERLPDVDPDRRRHHLHRPGITGREAVNLTRECLDYGAGAKIVGGVTPGRLGRDVHGVPVFDTVAQAVEHHGGPIKGSVVTVPLPHQGRRVRGDRERDRADRDRDRAHPARRRGPDGRAGRHARSARIIGPNCLGVIVPDVIKMGGIGGPAKDAAKAYTPGPVGGSRAPAG